ncbi:hypothetical protein CTI14_10885, partial [Methylobacterium radiotolerans]
MTGWGLRLLSWREIVAWADEWVLALPGIPDDLLAVSLSREPTREAQDGLARLAGHSNGSQLVPHLRALWAKKREAGELDDFEITRQAWKLRGGFIPYDSDDFLVLARMDHFSDEADGIYQLTAEQRAEARRHLAQEVAWFLAGETGHLEAAWDEIAAAGISAERVWHPNPTEVVQAQALFIKVNVRRSEGLNQVPPSATARLPCGQGDQVQAVACRFASCGIVEDHPDIPLSDRV